MNIIDAIGQATIDKVQSERPVPRFEFGRHPQGARQGAGRRPRNVCRSMKASASRARTTGVNSSFTVRKISFAKA